MHENVEQHKAFMDGFTAMESYFSQVRLTPEIYDGNKVQKMIETFGPTFTKHLTEEIETISPANLAKIFPVEKDLENNFKTMLAWVVKTSSKTTSFPWVTFLKTGLIKKIITHHDQTTAPWFLDMIPSIVVFLSRHVFYWFNKRYSIIQHG